MTHVARPRYLAPLDDCPAHVAQRSTMLDQDGKTVPTVRRYVYESTDLDGTTDTAIFTSLAALAAYHVERGIDRFDRHVTLSTFTVQAP